MDFRGDPSAALLEVLDPEQNHTFNDHYLDMDYDLSRVMFICTANNLQGIPAPLEDRLEIIRIAGYTELEKLAIAEQYLVPKQRQENGIARDRPRVARDLDAQHHSAVHARSRRAHARARNRQRLPQGRQGCGEERHPRSSKISGLSITPELVRKYLGVPKFRTDRREEAAEIGMATGLAWTQNGRRDPADRSDDHARQGQAHHHRQARRRDAGVGAGGDELRALARQLVGARKATSTSRIDVHIHVPEGAMPKDGPSAGITMATALVSALTKIPVRHDMAMTGEITLRGRVLPIGGLKEKALAAHRADIRDIIIPKENEKDIEEVPTSVARRSNSTLWSTWTKCCATRSSSTDPTSSLPVPKPPRRR